MKRIVGLVLVVLAVVGLVNVVRHLIREDSRPATGSSAYEQGRKFGTYMAPLVLALMGAYGLRLLLHSAGDLPPPIPRRNAPSHLPPPGDPSLRGGQDTFASNPARLRIHSGHWLAANQWVVITAVVLGGLGAIFLVIKFAVGVVCLLAAGILVFREVREARQKFWMGDVCPGVVIAASQNLVAVYTDLAAASLTPRPAIKILKQPLARFTDGPAVDGQRVATAALYHGDVQKAAWADFLPEVINCVVRDRAEIARVLNSIPEEEWQALDAGLAQIAESKPGLYPLALAKANLPEAPAIQLGETRFVPAKPWFATKPAIIGFVAVGALTVLLVLIGVIGSRFGGGRRPGPASGRFDPQPPQSRFPGRTDPARPTQAGPYKVGERVEANFTGRWIPGRITRINPGGFSLMVQLEDARFPQPIVLSTNRLRTK